MNKITLYKAVLFYSFEVQTIIQMIIHLEQVKNQNVQED